LGVFFVASLLYFARSIFQREVMTLEEEELRHVVPHWSMRDLLVGLTANLTSDWFLASRGICTVVRREIVGGIGSPRQEGWGPVSLEAGHDVLALGATLNKDERAWLTEILRSWLKRGRT